MQNFQKSGVTLFTMSEYLKIKILNFVYNKHIKQECYF